MDVPKRVIYLRKYLGKKYTVAFIDMEYVVYRDFGDGRDVEISCMPYRKKANVYFWLDKTRIIRRAFNVPYDKVAEIVERFRGETEAEHERT